MQFEGKKGLILGLLNKRSLAAACGRFFSERGATLGFTFEPSSQDDRRARMAVQAVEETKPAFVLPHDVRSEAHAADLLDAVGTRLRGIDFIVHCVSSARSDKQAAGLSGVTRAEFLSAMDISVFSLIECIGLLRPLLSSQASVVTFSYLSAERAVPGYELLGVCKAALEASVRHLAQELGPDGVRVNAISASPFASASALSNPAYESLRERYLQRAPRPLPSLDEIAATAGFLASPLSSGITGQIIHADAGYCIVGA